jgi:N-acetylglucosamine-6-phosphate deacetylase
MTPLFYHGCRILAAGRIIEGQGVLVRDGRIAALLPVAEAGGAEKHALPPDALLAPGLIDTQVNGGGGILFNDHPTPEAARAIAAAHRRLGTTAILPTLITSPPADFHQAAATIAEAIHPNTGVLGIHFEGPFISPAKPGVHTPAYIRTPNEADLTLLANLARTLPGPVLVTLAPECVAAADQTRLAEAGVILSAGHTAAPPERIAPPITGVTHIFNAMPPMATRDPGPAAAALAAPDLFAAVIADGIHVHPAMLRLLLRAKTPDRVLLVSDSMSVAGTQESQFTLQGRTIHRRDGRLVTDNGTLAGADLSLLQAVRTMVAVTGLDLPAALGMATRVPAAFLRLSHEIGDISPGLRADMVVLSPAVEVIGTVVAGAYQPA